MMYKKGDYVLVVAGNEVKENIWVEVINDLSARILEKPVILKDLNKGDEIKINDLEIISIFNGDKTKNLINDYKMQGKIPGREISGFLDVKRHINEWLDTDKTILKISNKDKDFFARDIQNLEAESNREIALEGIYRLFLSLIFMIITPRIVKYSDRIVDKYLRHEFINRLNLSSKILIEIAESHPQLLEQLRQLHASSKTEIVENRDLGYFFETIINEARSSIKD